MYRSAVRVVFAFCLCALMISGPMALQARAACSCATLGSDCCESACGHKAECNACCLNEFPVGTERDNCITACCSLRWQ